MKKIIYIFVCLFIGSANATIVDFESATTSTCQVTAGGSVDGFTLGAYDGNSGAGFNSSGQCWGIDSAYSGNNYMLNYNSVNGEFTKDIGVFDLNSLFVRAWDGYSGSVDFYGLDGVDGNILYSMSVTVTEVWQKITFTNWTNVKTFSWDPSVPNVANIAIDDFEYNATSVPEPAPLALLGLGLAYITIVQRKKST